MKVEERIQQASGDLRESWAEVRFATRNPETMTPRPGGMRLAAIVAATAIVVFALPLVLVLARGGNDVADGSFELPVELEQGFLEFEDAHNLSVDPIRRLLADGDFTREEYEPFANGVVNCVEATGLADAETYFQENEVDSGFGFRSSIPDAATSDEVDAVFDECEVSSLFAPATSAWLLINYPVVPSEDWTVVFILVGGHSEGKARMLGEALAGVDGVVAWEYFSQSAALAEALEMFSEDERQLRIIEQEPSIIPASIRVTAVDRETAAQIALEAESLPGWDIVSDAIVTEAWPATDR